LEVGIHSKGGANFGGFPYTLSGFTYPQHLGSCNLWTITIHRCEGMVGFRDHLFEQDCISHEEARQREVFS